MEESNEKKHASISEAWEQKDNPFWHRKEYSVHLINNFKYSNFKRAPSSLQNRQGGT